MEYLVFGRAEYAEPLGLVTTVEAASTPSVDDLGLGSDWLELVLVPADEIIWILRDGDPVRVDRRVRASVSEPEGGDRRERASVSEPEGGDRTEAAP
jgi:hypothetical protein